MKSKYARQSEVRICALSADSPTVSSASCSLTDFFFCVRSILKIFYIKIVLFSRRRGGVMNVQCFKVEIVVVMSMYVALILCFFCASV